jgi:hypothetical protein
MDISKRMSTNSKLLVEEMNGKSASVARASFSMSGLVGAISYDKEYCKKFL